jgi:fimbrial chaperone protein
MWCRLPLTIACGAAALCLAVPAFPAAAGTLQVNPVLITIDRDHRTGTVTVRNVEAAPVTIRAYSLAWHQAGGSDNYEESGAVIVSPPIFTIAPGGTQLVRVGLRNQAAGPQAYRLIIEEVPEATPMDGVRVALRLNIPLYAMIRAGDPALLRWSAERAAGGGWVIVAENPGSGYVRLGADAARNATGVRFDDTVNFGTVLPGATRRWPVPPQLRIEDAARFRQIQRTTAREPAAQGGN